MFPLFTLTVTMGCDTMTARSDPKQPINQPPRTQVFAPSALRGPSGMAFGKGRVALAASGKSIVVLSTSTLALEREVPGYAVAARRDGGLVMLDRQKLCLLPATAADPTCVDKLTGGPLSGLGWVWASDDDHLGMFEDDQIRTYALDGGKARRVGEVAPTFGAEARFAPFADGGVAWVDGFTLRVVDAQRHATTWSPPAAWTMSHLAAGPAGQLWIAHDTTSLSLVELGASPKVVRTIATKAIKSLAATATHVATVELDDSRALHVVVRDAAGAIVLERPLPDLYWPVGVALSAFDPLVGVGGDTKLIVWKLDGTLVGQRAPKP